MVVFFFSCAFVCDREVQHFRSRANKFGTSGAHLERKILICGKMSHLYPNKVGETETFTEMTIYTSNTHAQFPNSDGTLPTTSNNEFVQSHGKITTRLTLLTRTMQILRSGPHVAEIPQK